MSKFILIMIVVVFVIAAFTWFYLINIYEVKVFVNPKNLTTDVNSKTVVSVTPLNSFGSKALFRTVAAEFKILKGSELVNAVKIGEDKFELNSKGVSGFVEILATPQYGLFPSKVSIEITEN